MAQQKVRLRENHTLYFRHPGVNRGNPLVVRTGANAISWDYELIMNVEPTFGGEVQQVLACAVGPMTVGGSTLDNNQLKAIYEWFRAYGQVAGLNKRDEHGVLFQYPERGWEFYIQPNQMPNFGYAVDQIAREWTITAEIVADPAGQLQRATMNQFTERLFDPSMVAVGFRNRDPRSDPSADPSALPNSKNYADNFQSLLGAWASGDFAHWAFDSLARPAEVNHLDPNTKDFWTNFLGSDFVAGAPSTNQGSATLGSANPTTRDQIVATIASVFEGKNIPGELGVAVAYVESGLRPDARQDPTCQECGIGLFQVNGDGSGRVSTNQVKQAGAHTGDAVTKYYPTIQQIQDASDWFGRYRRSDLGAWAQAAQGAGDPAYISKINSILPEARHWIAQAGQVASGKRGQIVQFARAGLADSPLPYVFGGGRPPRNYRSNPGHFPGTDCSGYVTLCYMWAGAPDPNNSAYGGASTVAMLAATNSQRVSIGNVQPGDLVVYRDHVDMIVQVPANATTSNVQVIGHGGPPGNSPRTRNVAVGNADHGTPTYLSYL